MARRGRPPSERARTALIVHVKLRLYRGEDDDLIRFVDGTPRGLLAACVKRALREEISESIAGQIGEPLLTVLDDLFD